MNMIRKGQMHGVDDGFLSLREARSRIIDEHMQVWVAVPEGNRKLPDRLLR